MVDHLSKAMQKFLCKQIAVYWADPQSDGKGGYTYLDPEEIYCYWIEENEVIVSRDGKEVVSQAKVIVLQDVDDRGLLFLGTLDDLDSTEESDPSTVEGAYEIKAFKKVLMPTSTTDYFRMAYL